MEKTLSMYTPLLSSLSEPDKNIFKHYWGIDKKTHEVGQNFRFIKLKQLNNSNLTS